MVKLGAGLAHWDEQATICHMSESGFLSDLQPLCRMSSPVSLLFRFFVSLRYIYPKKTRKAQNNFKKCGVFPFTLLFCMNVNVILLTISSLNH